MKSKLFVLILLQALNNQIIAQDITQAIATKSDALKEKLITWRRYLHQNPELSNREFKTAAYIAEFLKKLGLEVQTGVAKTGVVAILKGGKAGPCIALRADIDALPIFERNNLPFKSIDSANYLGTKVPVMHACGHDTHVAMLMGTAEVLTSMKKDIAGTIKFIFQPAEEGPPGDEEGGAALMVKEGVMENPKVDVIFGMHINSQTQIGTLEYKSGAYMASSDWFTIKVLGKGSHGSQPWKGIDPISIAAQIIDGLQHIVSRQMELTKAPVVITVGKINGGVRNNIIPEEVIMEGTIRTLDSKMREDVQAKLKLTAESIAAASGAKVEVSVYPRTLVTYNTPTLVENMLPSLQKAAGKDKVKIMDWVTGAEDFSYYGTKAPSFFFNIGGQPIESTKPAPHHTSDFYIDDSNLTLGVKTFCQIVFDYPKTVIAKKN